MRLPLMARMMSPRTRLRYRRGGIAFDRHWRSTARRARRAHHACTRTPQRGSRGRPGWQPLRPPPHAARAHHPTSRPADAAPPPRPAHRPYSSREEPLIPALAAGPPSRAFSTSTPFTPSCSTAGGGAAGARGRGAAPGFAGGRAGRAPAARAGGSRALRARAAAGPAAVRRRRAGVRCRRAARRPACRAAGRGWLQLGPAPQQQSSSSGRRRAHWTGRGQRRCP